jgi:putative nucleotidyltransferase with HDIG domain
MSGPTIDSLVAGAGELASLPDSWMRVDAVLAHPASTSAQIADAIASDPGLSVRLLRMANSPLFGVSQKVERLSQAVHLIGTRQLRELALAASVIDMLAGDGRGERMQAFLRRSTAAALFARALASRRREPNIERFFVAGLLHDIGCFITELADPALTAADQKAARVRAEPIERIEQAARGFDHAALGAALIERWRLPTSLSESVAWHHEPSRATSHRIEAALVHLASVSVDLLGLGAEGMVCTPLDPRAWEQSGLDPAELRSVIAEMDVSLAPMLSILLGTPA